ncbi:MAG: DUF1616 domain-containing protein [Nitrososphaerota archaeon]|jgi:uncharacterized membrane protein|nr:DUF1616 domain-containing protein [Nitrososphaerota archaeon]
MTKKHIVCAELKKSQLASTEKAVLRKNSKTSVFSPIFAWFWVIITFTIMTAIMVSVISEGSYPLAYARLLFGAIFVLFVPGFCLLKMLFPTKLPIEVSSESLDKVERFVLSVGMSMVIVPIVGLLLNYTPWGIRFIPVLLSLVALTIFFALVAFVRDYMMVYGSKNQ